MSTAESAARSSESARTSPSCLPRRPSPASGSPEPDVYSPTCPSRVVLDRIGSRWVTLITGSLSEGTRRFSEIRRDVEGISEKVLAQTLRQLERDGLVTRTQHPTVPPHVDYDLTELGGDLDELHQQIRGWAEAHVRQILASQRDYDEARSASTS